jgi:DNA-binding NarL/FixJ family response regulator
LRPDPRVLVVDDDVVARRRVAAALGRGAIYAVADASRGRDGIRLATGFAPAVVIVDPELPDMGGLEFVQDMHEVAPQVRILVLTTRDDEDFAISLLRAGASGYLSKSLSFDILPRVVRSIAAGEAVVTRSLTMRLIERLRQSRESGTGLRPVRSALTSREWEVLDLICAGAGTRDIAHDLDLSIETVRSHIKRILRKLGAHSRGEAAEIAELMLADVALAEDPEIEGLDRSEPRFTRSRPRLNAR